FEATAAEREALPAAALTPLIFNIHAAATTVVAALERVNALRDPILALDGITAERFDRLRSYALAAQEAHARSQGTSRAVSPLPGIQQRAAAKTAMLARALEAAADKGLVGRDRLGALRGGVGYRETLDDLITAKAIASEAWPRLSGRTTLELGDVAEAE